jgi:glycosyltransferase involved in cell wall biosynthesis
MRILVDATNIINQPTGAGRYSYHVLKNLSEIDNHNKYTIIVRKDLKSDHLIFSCKNFTFLKLNIATIGIKRDIFLSLFLFFNRKKFDIFYCLMPYLPLFFSLKKSIITNHDLGYFRYPQYLKKIEFFYLKSIIKYSFRKATYIITISDYSKKEIINLFKVVEKKIVRVYEDSTLSKMTYFQCQYSILDFPYFLYIGERRPHKNLENLIKAFSLFKKNDQLDFKLVLVGKDHGNYSKKLISLIDELDLKKEVFILSSVDDEKLYCYYCYASALILISFYEGFGLPLVEAMKLEVPIIASNISIMQEIVGNSGLLVDPNNIEDISEKMKILINSEEMRKELIKKGIKKGEDFSWLKSARGILSLLNSMQKDS